MQREFMKHWSKGFVRVLLIGSLLSIGGLLGCQSSPSPSPSDVSTDTYVPLKPAGPIEEKPQPEPVVANRVQLAIPSNSPLWQGNFHAGSGYSDQFGVYYNGKAGFFDAQMPPGDYLLTYTTTLGQFYIVFRATANALIRIGLMDSDVVDEAMVYRGTVIDTSYTYYDDPVIVYSQFGAREGWWNLFRRDKSPGVQLIGGILVQYAPEDSLTLILPRPATYVLDYRTNLGTYHLEFQTTSVQEIKVIPLKNDEVILEAYVTVYE